MTEYLRIQFLLILFIVCSAPFSASAKDCITPDCFFERLGDAACKDNPGCMGKGSAAGQKEMSLPDNVVVGILCPRDSYVGFDDFVKWTNRARGVCTIAHVSSGKCLGKHFRQKEIERCRRWKKDTGRSCVEQSPRGYCCLFIDVDRRVCEVDIPVPLFQTRTNSKYRVCHEICTEDANGTILWGCGCLPLEQPIP